MENEDFEEIERHERCDAEMRSTEQCKHREECQASVRILFHKDECEHCEIAEKFKPTEEMVS